MNPMQKFHAKNNIKMMKKNIKTSGINVILIFTAENNNQMPYLFKKNELRELYNSDWDILGYNIKKCL
jgi:hypothetical protein